MEGVRGGGDGVGRECEGGSLSGGVGWERVREGGKGWVRMVGNDWESGKGEGRLSGRGRSGGGRKVGVSDGVVGDGRAMAEGIKATPGIRGLCAGRVEMEGEVWEVDVG